LGTLLSDISLPGSWLITLSACESSLVDYTDAADEVYGFPFGFLYAGAPTVIGSLWTAEDPANSILMIRLYSELPNAKTKPEALRRAQQWMKDATGSELADFVKSRGGPIQTIDYLRARSGRPYEHPYYWAPMQCVGI